MPANELPGGMISGDYPDIRRGPPQPGKVVLPPSLVLPHGTERYEVRGCGAVLVNIMAGDRISITNTEGGQVCEVMAITARGAIDSGLLGTPANSGCEGLLGMLADLDAVEAALGRMKIDLKKTAGKCIAVFAPDTPAGESRDFTATGDGHVVIAAPGGIMDFETQNTATPLNVIIRRASPQKHEGFDLPTPLADPLADIRVNSRTAEAYFVKAGDYIQIIDVDGRQCTDFQCFAARNIDKGRDFALDVTTTRTLMRTSYPMPGLYSKYYDHDMNPLVEVVQDTCGRHDAFALACTAKYYDDIGYPGHVNCSDNFNGALAGHGVNTRAGWMAINFFFNTAIDDDGAVISDEPWSRPGDYVLLKALTDIVCVSSACPDDTSPSNGWNPTDIHVRTYSGTRRFARAVAFRPTPDAEPVMTKETGFHSRFSEMTSDFTEYSGYWLANTYAKGGAIEEYHACRNKAVILDLSPLRKFEITGPDSEALCQYIFTRNIKTLPVGGVAYSAMCYPHGGMIDDGTVFRLGKDNFRWIGGSDYGGEWIREQAEKLGLNVFVRSSTDMQHNVAVQGPESRELLKKILWTAPAHPDFEQLDWFRFTPARLNEHNGIPVVASRTGYTGELGYEIFCHPKHAGEVFDAIWEAGRDHGLAPMGLEALDMVRIEAGLIFAGYDFDDTTDPFEAGIGFTTPLKSKPDDFIGRDALIRRKENPMHKFVGLEIDSNVDVGKGDCIHIGRAQIGEVTSSMRSPILGKNIALGRVDVAHHEIGTEVEIGKLDGQQKRLPAKITRFPHYDPEKTRPRS